MKILSTQLADVRLLLPEKRRDERGFFMETFRHDWFCEHIADCVFVQDNHSVSKRGVLRGLHFQLTHAQAKLVRVVSGCVLDVVVDLRTDSPTFGQWQSVVLSAENAHQLWIPAGLAHGFYAREDNTHLVYKCSDYYHPESERTLLWCDQTLAIDWQLDAPPIVSPKDEAGLTWTVIDKFSC